MTRLISVAETDQEALEIARRGANWTVGAYVSKEALQAFRPGVADIDPLDHYLNDVVVHGSPERVIDQLEELRETMSLSYLMLAPLSERSFQLFTDRVLPRVGH